MRRFEIGNRKDLYAGLFFIAVGVLFIVVSRQYPMGSALRMGPGYFPSILGGVLAVLGVAVAGQSFRMKMSDMPRIFWRPLLLVIGGVLAFSAILQTLGLVLAIMALVYISSFANWQFRFGEVTILFLLLVIMAVGVFVYGLGLPIKLGPM
jgi:hypothetical protein